MTELKLHAPGFLYYLPAIAILGLLTFYKVIPQEAGGAFIVALLGAMVPSGVVKSVSVEAPVAPLSPPNSGSVELLKAAEVLISPTTPKV